MYFPGTEGTPARVYVPRYPEFELPAVDVGPFVTDSEARGILLEATGAGLFREFERTLSGELASNPATLGVQLSDALVDALELTDRT